MFESWGRSWQLVKASWAVLQADKELLWFPVISGIITILICIVMFIPSVVVSITLFSTGASEGVTEVFGFVGLFIFYLVTYTISIYFNTALIGAAMIRMDGGDPTMKDGFDIANSRLGKIIGFAAMSATVGVIIRVLQERGGIVGNIVSWLGGIAWNLATFLVIPVLVTQNIGPIDAVKRSASLLRETWGEQNYRQLEYRWRIFVGLSTSDWYRDCLGILCWCCVRVNDSGDCGCIIGSDSVYYRCYCAGRTQWYLPSGIISLCQYRDCS